MEPSLGGRAVRPHRRAPRVANVAANVLDGLLVDQVAHDLHRLAAINSFFVEDATAGTSSSARTYRIARGQAPYGRSRTRWSQPAFEERSGASPRRCSPAGTEACGDCATPTHPHLPHPRCAECRRAASCCRSCCSIMRSCRSCSVGPRDARALAASPSPVLVPRRRPTTYRSSGPFDRDRLNEQQVLDEFRALRRR